MLINNNIILLLRLLIILLSRLLIIMLINKLLSNYYLGLGLGFSLKIQIMREEVYNWFA